MTNYPYIISSFPDLLLDFERHPIDTDAVIAEVKSQLSAKDCMRVDWLLFGLEGSHLTPHFYRKIGQVRSRFLTEWFAFDRKLRLAKVAYLNGRALPEAFAESDKAEVIFRIENLFQREKLLDRLCWDKAAELVQFDVFTLDTILSMIVRLHIAARWSRLDPATGAAFFKQLVSEVRGTFQGIHADQL